MAGWIEKDGTDAVRKALNDAAGKAIERTAQIPIGGYVAVGYDGDRSVVWSIPRRQSLHVLTPRDLGDAMLQTICGAAWCAANYTTFSERGTTKLDLAQLRGELIDACLNAGAYSSKEIRGAGCWKIAKGVLAVNSEQLWRTDGAPIERISKSCVYPVSKSLGLSPDTPEASDAEAHDVLDLLRAWRWRHPGNALLLAGWLAQAPVVGTLERRPHVIVTGARGTAAGLRQHLGHDAKAVMLDEFEAKSEREAHRVNALVEQIRSAYSDSVGHGVLRGTADGAGTAFAVRYSALASMIVPPAMEAADRTRFAMLSLLPLARGAQVPTLALDEARLADLGVKLRALWPVTTQN